MRPLTDGKTAAFMRATGEEWLSSNRDTWFERLKLAGPLRLGVRKRPVFSLTHIPAPTLHPRQPEPIGLFFIRRPAHDRALPGWDRPTPGWRHRTT